MGIPYSQQKGRQELAQYLAQRRGSVSVTLVFLDAQDPKQSLIFTSTAV